MKRFIVVEHSDSSITMFEREDEVYELIEKKSEDFHPSDSAFFEEWIDSIQVIDNEEEKIYNVKARLTLSAEVSLKEGDE